PSPAWGQEDTMPYSYKNTRGVTYYLHQGTVKLAGSNVERPIYYFRKEPDEKAIDAVPAGYEVVEGARGARESRSSTAACGLLPSKSTAWTCSTIGMSTP